MTADLHVMLQVPLPERLKLSGLPSMCSCRCSRRSRQQCPAVPLRRQLQATGRRVQLRRQRNHNSSQLPRPLARPISLAQRYVLGWVFLCSRSFCVMNIK